MTVLNGVFSRAFRRRRPVQLLGQYPRIGHIGHGAILLGRAGEQERPPGVLADRRIDSQRHRHVHRIADGKADHRMRAMHRPSKAALGCKFEQHIFLRIVEIQPRQTRAAFQKRRVGFHLGIIIKRAKVVLQPRHQGRMFDRRIRQPVKQIADHQRVDAHVLGLILLARPGAEEYMRDVRRSLQCLQATRSILKIRRDMAV